MLRSVSAAAAVAVALALEACSSQQVDTAGRRAADAVASGARDARPALHRTEHVADEAALAAAVRASLIAQTGVNAFGVHVGVHDKVVTLSGRVKTAAIKATVLEAARKTSAQRIVDRLAIGT